MPNILDYLDWRGDLEFHRDPINEVDNLVFSVLAYMDFAGAVPSVDEFGSVSLADASEAIKQMPDQITAPITSTFFSRLPLLLEKCAQSERYQGVRLSHYVNRVSFDEAEQFSALVFSTDENTHLRQRDQASHWKISDTLVNPWLFQRGFEKNFVEMKEFDIH